MKQFAFARSHLLLKVDKVVVGGLTLILLKGVRVLVGRVALPFPATTLFPLTSLCPAPPGGTELELHTL